MCHQGAVEALWGLNSSFRWDPSAPSDGTGEDRIIQVKGLPQISRITRLNMVDRPDILHQLSQLIWKIRISLESLGIFFKFDIRFLLIILKKGEKFFLKGVFFNKIFVYIL